MDPATVANGLASNPLAWGLALTLGAVVYLFRELNSARQAHIETIKADAKEQREILTQIVPLSAKLTEGLEILERMTKG